MTTYVLRRLLSFVPTVFAISFLVFLMLYFIPGDPAQVILGLHATPANVASLREMMGLNDPLHVRMAKWYGAALRGDFGRSYYLDRSVTDAIVARLPVTFTLTGLSLLLAVLLGIPAGILAATRQNSWWDAVIMGASLIGLSVPGFLLGMLMVYFLAIPVPWLPTGGYVPLLESPLDGLRHMLLPATALGMSQAALIARMTRSSMLEVLRLDYVRTARSKGLGERAVVYRHAFANSLIHVITVVGLAAGVLLGGSIVVEKVFSLPGLGLLVVSAVQRRDFPVVQGVIIVITISFLTVNLIVDILYAFANPRVRYA